jgi:hypothetical protein
MWLVQTGVYMYFVMWDVMTTTIKTVTVCRHNLWFRVFIRVGLSRVNCTIHIGGLRGTCCVACAQQLTQKSRMQSTQSNYYCCARNYSSARLLLRWWPQIIRSCNS